METTEELMQAASEVAALAGAIALAHFRTALDVERKADGSEVTIADRAAEQAARDWLAKRFPRDGILGEEFGETAPRIGAGGPAARRNWIVDPIDGTKSFVKGVPLWGTLVAVMDGDTVLASACDFAAAGEHLAAGLGCGAWWNGRRARVSETDTLARATLLCTDAAFQDRPDRGLRWRACGEDGAILRSWGDCFGYLMVATGRAELMTDSRLNLWDAAPVQLPVLEAGGVFTDWTGAATVRGAGAIATNAALAQVLRARLLDTSKGGAAAREAGDA